VLYRSGLQHARTYVLTCVHIMYCVHYYTIGAYYLHMFPFRQNFDGAAAVRVELPNAYCCFWYGPKRVSGKGRNGISKYTGGASNYSRFAENRARPVVATTRRVACVVWCVPRPFTRRTSRLPPKSENQLYGSVTILPCVIRVDLSVNF